MKRKWMLALVATGVIVGGLQWVRAGQQGPDPLKVAADTHKLAFENAFVKVLEVHVPPGKIEPWHGHSRRVVVYLSDFNTRVTTEKGGKPVDTLRKRGLVRWSEPIVHQVENIGTTEGHVISIELK
jgi:hypothetical protein